jgi:cytochrome c biogenesis protein CcdA
LVRQSPATLGTNHCGLIIIAFGLQLIGLLKISTLYKDTRFFSQDKPRGILGSITLGWLSQLVGHPASTDSRRHYWFSSDEWWLEEWPGVVGFLYSAGLAVPFLLTGLGINKFLASTENFAGTFTKLKWSLALC